MSRTEAEMQFELSGQQSVTNLVIFNHFLCYLSRTLIFNKPTKILFEHYCHISHNSVTDFLSLVFINVVNVPRFQSCHFLGYQSFAQSRVAQTSHKGVTTVHSVKAR